MANDERGTAMTRRWRRVGAVLVGAALVPLVAACTPRAAEILVDNATPWRLSLIQDGVVVATVEGFTSEEVEFGTEGDCMRPPLYAEADGKGGVLSALLGEPCDGDEIVVESTDLARELPTMRVENATTVLLDVTAPGFSDEEPVPPGGTLDIPLAAAPGGCVGEVLAIVRHDSGARAAATHPSDRLGALAPTPACAGDTWVVVRNDLRRWDDNEEAWVPFRGGRVILTNLTDTYLQLTDRTTGHRSLGMLMPGDSRELVLEHLLESCEIAVMGLPPADLSTGGPIELGRVTRCDGAEYVVTADGYVVAADALEGSPDRRDGAG